MQPESSGEQSQDLIRRAVLDAVLERWPHDDPGSLPEELARYVLVQDFKEPGQQSHWLDLCDEPESKLAACREDFDDSGYLPFLLVDLDDGSARLVRNWSVAEPEAYPELEAAALQACAQLALKEPSARLRLSDLAELSDAPLAVEGQSERVEP